MSRERPPSLYEFGPFVIDEGRRRLLRGAETVSLTRKEFETLLVLVRGGGRVVEKDELMRAIWPETHVEEGNLAVHISKLRGKLGRREDGTPYIETETGRGYRFTAQVREAEEFDLVIRKRTRAHVVTREVEESDGDARPAPLPAPAGVTARARPARRATLVLAAVALVAAGAFALNFSSRRGDAPAKVRTLAVLPFTLLKADAEDEYLGLGMADALITRLSNVRQFVVRPTSAVRRFNGAAGDAAEAGRQLGVEAVLEGSIQKAGDRVRVTAQLVRTSDGRPLWAGTFDEPSANVFVVQDAISEQLAGALALDLTGNERASLARHYTEDADAQQLYAKGRYYWSKRDFEGMTKAEAFFRQAIERDPNFAPAYIGLSDTLAMRGVESEQEIEAAQRKALELAPDLAEAHASLGFANMFHRWDWAGAERELRRAAELNPGYGTAHQWLATLYAITGRVEEAKAEMRRALEIDPQSPNFLADMGQMHYFAHEYAEAEDYCRRALEVAPDFVFAHGYLAFIYAKTGRNGEALEEILKAEETMSAAARYQDSERRRHELMERYGREGILGLWRNEAASSPQKISDPAVFYNLALACAGAGEKERALAALTQAVERHTFLIAFIRAEPMFDGLRGDPRYQALLRRMNLAPQP